MGNPKLFQVKGQVPIKGDIIAKMGWGHVKIFVSRTTEPEELIFT
jgi:hypothetical protein